MQSPVQETKKTSEKNLIMTTGKVFQLKIQINLLSVPFNRSHCKINDIAKLFHRASLFHYRQHRSSDGKV